MDKFISIHLVNSAVDDVIKQPNGEKLVRKWKIFTNIFYIHIYQFNSLSSNTPPYSLGYDLI
ncbi:MAG: hypothetical protein HRU38_03465 [Saccharospirillaceae bacterium]|nr:hypothetical protein [Pseudomonadales bacterium]NRB77721.1 hypothetical protein [Saccharospirillaceae bacterium]